MNIYIPTLKLSSKNYYYFHLNFSYTPLQQILDKPIAPVFFYVIARCIESPIVNLSLTLSLT